MALSSIPASDIVRIVPDVLAAGGSGLDLVGLILTDSTRPPVGQVVDFANAQDVSDYFGPLSVEARLAAAYFPSYNGSIIKPAVLRFVQYPTAAVPAYLRGGPASSMTLAQLQALSGTLTLTIDGRSVTSSAINLSGATSFSNAASLIQTGLNDKDAVVTGSIAGTTLTVSAVTSGTLAIGQTISGTGVTAGTKITALGTGTGGTGTYTVSTSQTASSTTITAGATTVAFDSQSGAFVITAGTPGAVGTITFASGALATSLFLTAATGAVVSQGADATTPAQSMAAVTALTQNFVSFMTSFKPTIADMVAFAQWNATQGNRFLYAMWDNDLAPTTSSDTTSAGYLIAQAELSGTAPIFAPVNGASAAAFLMGTVASIDFTRFNGRTTAAFRSSPALTAADVTNQTIASNLRTNGYNYYGAYATAADRFVFNYPGSVTGPFDWIDSYVNQIWMNNGFQLALMTLLTQVGSIPYNADGYVLIEAAMADQIAEALNFGAIRAGVPLSEQQAAIVNGAAGFVVSDTIAQRGWYVLVQAASPSVRAARGSPTIIFWYTDGQSVQQITLSSVLVQ